MSDSLTRSWEKLRDWTYDHYHWAYAIGTGVLCQSIFFPSKTLALISWLGSLAVGALLEPCVNPQRQIYGRGRWRLTQDNKLRIALTFDDGPGPDTPALLDVLARYNVKANFFCVGQQVEKHPDLARRIADGGHLIGNHTYSHPNLMLLSPHQTRRELSLTQEIIFEHTGQRPVHWRPPYGFRAPWTQAVASRLGLESILWSVNPRDFQDPGVDTLFKRVANGLVLGTILLLHDGFNSRSQTVELVDRLIPELQGRGYRFVRLDDPDA